jgi:hypothetical protein
MVLANNAIYNPGRTAVDASGLANASVTVKTNFVQGQGVSIDNDGFFDGTTVESAFVDTATKDLWPSPDSVLRGHADPVFVPELDFNRGRRKSPYDVGAYETDGRATNPGWKVVPGFKKILRPPRGLRFR